MVCGGVHPVSDMRGWETIGHFQGLFRWDPKQIAEGPSQRWLGTSLDYCKQCCMSNTHSLAECLADENKRLQGWFPFKEKGAIETCQRIKVTYSSRLCHRVPILWDDRNPALVDFGVVGMFLVCWFRSFLVVGLQQVHHTQGWTADRWKT